jgi:hypothetical protein
MKYLKLILVFTITLNSALAQTTSNSYSRILTKFEEWKTKQYQSGKYEREKNCNAEYVSKDNYKGSNEGISEDIQIFYTDLNSDNIIDAIICFNPYLCDGGNALMNAQERVIIVSKVSEYIIDDKTINNIEKELTSGWLFVRGAHGDITGEFQDYNENDGRCCPSIIKPFSISYKDKKIEYTGQ